MTTKGTGRAGVVIGALACLAVTLAACGGGSGKRQETATTVSPTTTTPLDLATLLLPAPPRPGFTPVTDVFGPFTLDRFLQNFSTEEADDRALLTGAGFVRGDSRGWVDSARNPTVLATFVFEFRDAAAAASVRDQLVRQDPAARPFAVPAVPDAVGMTSTVRTDSGGERAHSVAFTRGPRVFVVAAQHTNATASTELVVELAKAQAALVP